VAGVFPVLPRVEAVVVAVRGKQRAQSTVDAAELVPQVAQAAMAVVAEMVVLAGMAVRVDLERRAW